MKQSTLSFSKASQPIVSKKRKLQIDDEPTSNSPSLKKLKPNSELSKSEDDKENEKIISSEQKLTPKIEISSIKKSIETKITPKLLPSDKDILISLRDSSKLKPLSHKQYDPIKDCIFEQDQPVPFCLITTAFEEVAKCKGENSKDQQKQIISNMFKSIIYLRPDHLIMTYYLCILKLTPDYIPSELGIGNEILVKSVAKISGRSEKQIRDSVNKIGDIGTVASESKATQSTINSFFEKNKKTENILTVKKVFDTLLKMAKIKGNLADKEREGFLLKLLFDAKGDEVKYIIRWINKNLKIGVAEATMQSALARTFCSLSYDKKYDTNFDEKCEKFENIIKRCVCEFPNYDAVIEGLLNVGSNIEELLNLCKMRPGVPVKPMLAKPTKEIAIIFKRFENIKFTCEYKYDGLRGQIHYNDGICHIFSRNLMDMTETYPDIIEFVKKNTNKEIKNFVMDSEIVAVDTRTNKILPFQQLTSRSRKNVDKNEIEINVCLYMFDLLYLNDQSLLQEPLTKRRQLIRENFTEVENKLIFASHLDSENIEEIQDFLNESVRSKNKNHNDLLIIFV